MGHWKISDTKIRTSSRSDKMKLQGKVALITGAGTGIGAETAKLFTKLGATIAVLSTTEQNLMQTVTECEQLSMGQPKPLMFVGSVTDAALRKKAVEDIIETFEKLDVLVNNAGITKPTSILHSSLDELDEIFDVNIRSVFHLTQLAAPHLIKTKGSVINVSSVAAHKVSEGRIVYGMSKAALNHFTRYAAQELGKHGVRVNSISPGLTRTNFPVKNYGLEKQEAEKYYENNEHLQALQRCGEPSEIADLIAFLASGESSFITGTDILIDGGLLVNGGFSATPSTTRT